MKELSIERMEMVRGFLSGACGVLGLTRGGMVVRAAFGRAAAFAIPGAGQVLAVATVGCIMYGLLR